MAGIDVVKCDSNRDIFAWKFPNSELSTFTQLIVNESQEAVLYKGGRALDLFTSGTYTLGTNNIPLLNKLINLPFGKRSPFSAEVWYVNKAHLLDIKWGTSTPLQIQDPKYGVFLPVRSYGQFGIQIEDSRKFLLKLAGTQPVLDKDTLEQYFRGMYVTMVKDTVSAYLVQRKISVLEINAYLNEISEFMRERLAPAMLDYGIKLCNFFVNDISVPDSDPGVQKLKEALAKRAEMDILGYSYQQGRSLDILEGAAKNEGSAASSLMGAGLGLGMGGAMGNAAGLQMAGIAAALNVNTRAFCSACGHKLEGQVKFCPECGEKLS